jgi:hypothetical protein
VKDGEEDICIRPCSWLVMREGAMLDNEECANGHEAEEVAVNDCKCRNMVSLSLLLCQHSFLLGADLIIEGPRPA